MLGLGRCGVCVVTPGVYATDASVHVVRRRRRVRRPPRSANRDHRVSCPGRRDCLRALLTAMTLVVLPKRALPLAGRSVRFWRVKGWTRS